MYNVLVAWLEIPEDQFFIVFKGLNEQEYNEILRYHGSFINQSCPEFWEEQVHEKHIASMTKFFYDDKFAFKFEKVQEAQNAKDFNSVIMCGFLC